MSLRLMTTVIQLRHLAPKEKRLARNNHFNVIQSYYLAIKLGRTAAFINWDELPLFQNGTN